MNSTQHSTLSLSRRPTITLFFAALVLATLAFGMTFFSIYHDALQEASLDPESIYGGPLPVTFSHAMAFKARGGAVAQLVHLPSNAKLSIALSEPWPGSSEAKGGEKGVMEILRAYQGVRSHPKRLAPLIKDFLAAQIDARRAVDLTADTVTIHGIQIPLQRFVGKNDENFVITVINLQGRQVALLFMTVGKQLSLQVVETILNEMPILQSVPR